MAMAMASPDRKLPIVSDDGVGDGVGGGGVIGEEEAAGERYPLEEDDDDGGRAVTDALPAPMEKENGRRHAF